MIRFVANSGLPLIHPVTRVILGATSALFLLHAIVYGPSRGITLISPNSDFATWLALSRISGYACFTLAAVNWKGSLKLTAIILGIGLILRSFLEARASLAVPTVTGIISNSGEFPWLLLLTSLAFYLFSFILPALLFVGFVRASRRN